MVDIEELKPLIIERLKPLNPGKIVLFGSYAYGTPNEESDIDLFLLKDDLDVNEKREFLREVRMQMLSLISKYKICFDILSASMDYIKTRECYFCKVER